MLLKVEVVEVTPTTVASFVQIVAIQTVLHGEIFLDPEPDPDSGLKHGVGGKEIAWATATLILDLRSEVIAVDILPVPLSWHLV